MSFTFERTYQILVGSRINGSFTPLLQIEPPHHFSMNFVDSIPNTGSSLNLCEIMVYNIGKENIKTISAKNLKVIVKADYKYRNNKVITPTEAQQVYSGDIVNITHNHTGTDVVTTLICQEGYHSAVKAKLKKPLNYSRGTPLISVFADLLSYMPYAHELRFSGSNKTLQKSLTLENGQIIKSLDFLCSKVSKPDEGINITWMFHRDKILVLDKRPKTATRKFQNHEIPRAMIKGTIDIGFDERMTTDQISKPSISELKFRTYLLPQLSIGDNITIESDGLSGSQEVTIISIGSQLSYDGNSWDSLITGRVQD